MVRAIGQEERPYTLDRALAFKERVTGASDAKSICPIELGKALNALAVSQREDSFRGLVDRYAQLARRSAHGRVGDDPMGFLEWLCAVNDRNAFEVSIAVWERREVRVGQTQSYFMSLYGTHFSPETEY